MVDCAGFSSVMSHLRQCLRYMVGQNFVTPVGLGLLYTADNIIKTILFLECKKFTG